MLSSICRQIGKYSSTKANVRERNNTVDSNCPSSSALPVRLLSQDASSSMFSSTTNPPLRSAVTALMYPGGVLSSRMLPMASLSLEVMSLLEVPGGKSVVPGLGSRSIWQAQIAARPTARSTLGGSWTAAMELYDGLAEAWEGCGAVAI